MKNLLLSTLALVLTAAALIAAPMLLAPPQSAVGFKAGRCIGSVYVRTSTNYSVLGNEDYIECDTDSGLPITVTLPATPGVLERHEVWHAPQGSQTVTLDTQGQAAYGASLSFSGAISGRVVVWIDADGPGPNGGYWRVTAL